MNKSPPEITELVVETVADFLGVSVEDLPPLRETVDPDALDALVSSAGIGPSSDITITFTYAGQHVTVRPGRMVCVRPLQDESEGPSSVATFGDR